MKRFGFIGALGAVGTAALLPMAPALEEEAIDCDGWAFFLNDVPDTFNPGPLPLSARQFAIDGGFGLSLRYRAIAPEVHNGATLISRPMLKGEWGAVEFLRDQAATFREMEKQF